MTYSVHDGLAPPQFFETKKAALEEYDRRSADPRNLFVGWVGMLHNGCLCHYNGWESSDVDRLCRRQLETVSEKARKAMEG